MNAAAPSVDAKIAQIRATFDGARLRGVARLRELRPQIDDGLLLHAGPPLAAGELPQPIRNAAIHALVYAGKSPAEAARALDDGAVRLAPAQDYGVVTPLAQVVSAAMPVFRVGDGAREVYAPIAESAPPALRFGSADPVCVDHLRQHARWAFDELAPRLERHAPDVADVIAQALAEGDECHARTGAANAALLDALGPVSSGYAEAIAANANFVLPMLMAASAWALQVHENSIAAVGGNGRQFGLRFAHDTRWRTTPATPPVGTYMPGHAPGGEVLGAVGDSPVIDFCGLGGQALAFAPELVAAWAEQLPRDWAERAAAVTDPDTGLVCRHRINAGARSPLVHLAMVAAGAEGGLAGRGFYEPPTGVFEG